MTAYNTRDIRVGDIYISRNAPTSEGSTPLYTVSNVFSDSVHIKTNNNTAARSITIPVSDLNKNYILVREVEDTPDINEPGDLGTVLRFKAIVCDEALTMYSLAKQNEKRDIYIERIKYNDSLGENWQDLKTECLYTWIDILRTSVPGSIELLMPVPINGTGWEQSTNTKNNAIFNAEDFIVNLSDKVRKSMLGYGKDVRTSLLDEDSFTGLYEEAGTALKKLISKYFLKI